MTPLPDDWIVVPAPAGMSLLHIVFNAVNICGPPHLRG